MAVEVVVLEVAAAVAARVMVINKVQTTKQVPNYCDLLLVVHR